MLDWASLYIAIGGKLSPLIRQRLRALADRVARRWREPDQGLWEARRPPRHHVHSKLMCWVALARAIEIFGPQSQWIEQRDQILRDLHHRGIGSARYLVQAYGNDATDAALLLAGMLDVALEPSVLRNTVTQVEQSCAKGPLFIDTPQQTALIAEGAFLICSFWLVDALLRVGRHSEAKMLFEDLLTRANDVGLFGEQIDPITGAFLGNFPQAFTHLALIQAATHLDLHQRRGPEGLAGTHANRARRLVTATLGWRGWWAAVRHNGRVGRVFPSKASVLDPALWRPKEAL